MVTTTSILKQKMMQRQRLGQKSSLFSRLWFQLTTTTTTTILGITTSFSFCSLWAKSSSSLSVVDALDPSLLNLAARVRQQHADFTKFPLMIPHDNDTFYFPSAYAQNGNANTMRGFCNWIIPNRIMVGQYPSQNPETSGPTVDEVQEHLQSMIDPAGVTLFVSLQSELPPQSDYSAWEDVNGQVYLQDSYWRRQFPNPFTHYAPIVNKIMSSSSSLLSSCQFWHAPIEDLSVPNSSSLQELLQNLLQFFEENDDCDTKNCVYIHCWGGRGRAGLVSACLLSLLYPEMDAQEILNIIQTGYDSRAGADLMPRALSKSPQTESQRAFVRSFVQERQRFW